MISTFEKSNIAQADRQNNNSFYIDDRSRYMKANDLMSVAQDQPHAASSGPRYKNYNIL